MKIETRKRKRATQKVKAKFFFGPKGECFVSAFQKVTSLSFWSLRYPFGHFVILLVIRSALLLALE